MKGPRCELITTGEELLLGRTLNSHLSWLGRALFGVGARLDRNVTVGDGAVIGTELTRALAENDVVLVTGGLGPTSDDVTREIVAQMLGLDLQQDEEVWQRIVDYMRTRGKELNLDQDRQAQVPRGAKVLHNSNGTAPGLMFEGAALEGRRARMLILLPGPPAELHPMVREQVLAPLEELARVMRGGEDQVEIAEWKVIGLGESEVAEQLSEALAGWEAEGLEIGFCARAGEVNLRFIGSEEQVKRASALVHAQLGEAVVGEGDLELEELVVRLLAGRGERLALAESCTGGLVAHWITSVAGASAVFELGVVAYANRIKAEVLGVDSGLLERKGAVSQGVVEAMALGARELARAEWAISISGIAGPEGGTEEKPLGTVWLGLAGKGGVISKRLNLRGDRTKIQELAARSALDWLRRELERAN